MVDWRKDFENAIKLMNLYSVNVFQGKFSCFNLLYLLNILINLNQSGSMNFRLALTHHFEMFSSFSNICIPEDSAGPESDFLEPKCCSQICTKFDSLHDRVLVRLKSNTKLCKDKSSRTSLHLKYYE